MKRKPVLYRQSVKRKHPMNFSEVLRVARLVTSFSLKIVCLFIGAVTISILFLYLYQYLLSTPYIKLREVSIEGVDDGLKSELIELADLDSELSLLTLNLNEMKKRMESHPWVRTVKLEKSFPHLLRIRAEMERPFAIVALDRLYYMNRWGVAFKEIDYNDNKDYPGILFNRVFPFIFNFIFYNLGIEKTLFLVMGYNFCFILFIDTSVKRSILEKSILLRIHFIDKFVLAYLPGTKN